MKKVLIACEESQAVTIEFRKHGFEAYSCDIQDCSGGHPEWHIKWDVIPLLNGKCSFYTMDGAKHVIEGKWDMIIAFPPCTNLASSGARWFAEKKKNGSQQASIEFFMLFVNADCERVAIENPVGIMSSIYRKPDQITQPWHHGHGEQKATCLWLKNLPVLVPTNIVEGREQRVWKMPPSKDRAKLRSRTYQGIAKAMAEQWGAMLTKTNDLENPMTQTDYTPMIDADKPFHSCDWCGCNIYPGEKYLDLGEIICDECVSEHMKEA